MTIQTPNRELTSPTPTSTSETRREVEAILRAPELHWVGDGFRVMGYFSAYRHLARRLSPFLLLDYHPPYNYPPTDNTRRGVGSHPHRGFETVTLAFEGSVAHHDSAGHGGVIGPGDVQWMTAASGILHREYHEENYARRGGPFHMMQLWVNLPSAHKMSPPRYQGLTAGEMGQVTLPDGAGLVRVVAGEYLGVKGPAKTFTPVNLFDVRLRAGGEATFSFPAEHNTALVVMKGAVTVNGGRRAAENELVVFDNKGERFDLKAESDTHAVLLNGEPIREPIAQYGPFVMNTENELAQAMLDFNRGLFGHLDD
ncbi:pirin family protein [Myxococcaceae bacterium GXIMD 01537]